MSTPGQQLDDNLGQLWNAVTDLQKRMDDYEGIDPPFEPEPDPVTPPPLPGTRRFGCNIGYHVDRPWSPDKPDDPRYVAALRPVAKVLRFMDWWKTNDVVADNWNSELLNKCIGLALACGSDYYGNLNFYDTHETIVRKVKMVRDAMPNNKRRYWEWANEPWNLGTNVAKEIKRLSGRERFGGGADLAYFDVWANKASEAFAAVKSADPDAVTVLGCLTANKWVAEKVEERLTVKPDAHGLTTYFGSGLGGTPPIDTSVGDILYAAEMKLNDKEIPRVLDHLQYSKSIGRECIAYEGGPHFTLSPSLHESHRLVWQNMNEANRHPQIMVLCSEMMDAWFRHGGGDVCWYNFLSVYDQWGSWGLGESLDTIDQSPKYRYAAGIA